jgi:hypothetical protein
LDRTPVGITAVAEPADLGGRQGRSADDMESVFDCVKTVQACFHVDFTGHDLAAPTLTHIRVLCHQLPDPSAALPSWHGNYADYSSHGVSAQWQKTGESSPQSA